MVTADAFGEHLPVFGELRSDEGRSWLASLPSMVAELEAEWGLRTGSPFTRGTGAWTAPAITAEGEPAVLKVGWPHREARYKADGLRLWDGAGAVRVLRSDGRRWAMLIERCVPGLALDECGLTGREAMDAAADVLLRLWSAPVPSGAPFEQLGDVTREWAGLVRGRMDRHRPPFDAGLVELGASLLETLPVGGRTVVLHGDFNPGNILSAARAPFLAIDAKPMVGDAAYDPSQLVTQLDGMTVEARAGYFAGMVDVPVERILAWGVARSVEGALWDVAQGRTADLEAARTLARAAGL